MKFNTRELKFRRAAKLVFDTPEGRELLAYLKDSYVNATALQPTVEATYYKLGQKEFVQSLIATISDESELDNIIIENRAIDD